MVFASRHSGNAVVRSVKPIGRPTKAAPINVAGSKLAKLGDGRLKATSGTVARIDPVK